MQPDDDEQITLLHKYENGRSPVGQQNALRA